MILPLLSLLFLISTPGLVWAFRRFKINLQKLEFWVLVTSGTAWILVLILFLLKPDQDVNPIWDAGFSLLPSLAFALDGIGSTFALAVTALVFFGLLVEKTSPQTSAWVTPLAGVLLMILLADSAYTAALGWTVLEALFLYRFLKNQGELESSTRYIVSVLTRLAAPLLLIYLSLYYSSTGTAPMLSDLPPEAAYLVFAAGAVGFWGWFQTSRETPDPSQQIRLIHSVNWLPASFGLLIITRATTLISLGPDLSWTADLAAGLTSALLVALTVFLPSDRLMRIGCLILMAGGYLSQSPTSAANMAILFLLPGVILLWEPESKKTALIKLITASVGLIPLPLFPAWMGLAEFGGLAAYFLAAAYGLLTSRILLRSYQKWLDAEYTAEEISILEMVGLGVVLVSQYLIAFQLGLFTKGLRFGEIPISVWLAPILLGLGTLLWTRLPAGRMIQKPMIGEKGRSSLKIMGSYLTGISGEIVHLMTRLFEGDGGLIWTTLLAFLIFSLLRSGGG